MGHPTTKEIKLGEFDHANITGILREEFGEGFMGGRALVHLTGERGSTGEGIVQENYFLRA